MPFGLKNAPTEFNRIIYRILGNRKHVKIYFDDIIVHYRGFEDHLKHVKAVLGNIKEAGLKLKSSKCKWFCKMAKILGHVISEGKVEMDSEKVEPFKNRAPPTTVKQLQEFLGICNYYRKFVKNFAKIVLPLTELLKGDVNFVWGENQQSSFEKLKNALILYPILQQPVYDRPFILHTDASGHGLGAVLAQKDEEVKEYVLSYALARWAIYLQAYDFNITHRKGSSHGNADALSRPVLLVTTRGNKHETNEDAYVSAKNLDPYEDEGLLFYLRNKKHLAGSSIKQIRRIERLSNCYKIEINNLGEEKLYFFKEKTRINL